MVSLYQGVNYRVLHTLLEGFLPNQKKKLSFPIDRGGRVPMTPGRQKDFLLTLDAREKNL